MPKQDYIPNRDPEFLTWHDNFRTEVAKLKATFGLAETDIVTVTSDNATIHTQVSAAECILAAVQTAMKEKDATRRQVERNAQSLAQKLKAHTNYTEALGCRLGIIGPEWAVNQDFTSARPHSEPLSIGGGCLPCSLPANSGELAEFESSKDPGSQDVLPKIRCAQLLKISLMDNEDNGHTSRAASLTNARPILTVDDSQPHCVVIGFNKGNAHGVNLYSKRPGEANFTFLARDTESPYVDTRPCLGDKSSGSVGPEQRQYYAFYVFHDEKVGLQSDVVEASCHP